MELEEQPIVSPVVARVSTIISTTDEAEGDMSTLRKEAKSQHTFRNFHLHSFVTRTSRVTHSVAGYRILMGTCNDNTANQVFFCVGESKMEIGLRPGSSEEGIRRTQNCELFSTVHPQEVQP